MAYLIFSGIERTKQGYVRDRLLAILIRFEYLLDAIHVYCKKERGEGGEEVEFEEDEEEANVLLMHISQTVSLILQHFLLKTEHLESYYHNELRLVKRIWIQFKFLSVINDKESLQREREGFLDDFTMKVMISKLLGRNGRTEGGWGRVEGRRKEGGRKREGGKKKRERGEEERGKQGRDEENQEGGGRRKGGGGEEKAEEGTEEEKERMGSEDYKFLEEETWVLEEGRGEGRMRCWKEVKKKSISLLSPIINLGEEVVKNRPSKSLFIKLFDEKTEAKDGGVEGEGREEGLNDNEIDKKKEGEQLLGEKNEEKEEIFPFLKPENSEFLARKMFLSGSRSSFLLAKDLRKQENENYRSVVEERREGGEGKKEGWKEGGGWRDDDDMELSIYKSKMLMKSPLMPMNSKRAMLVSETSLDDRTVMRLLNENEGERVRREKKQMSFILSAVNEKADGGPRGRNGKQISTFSEMVEEEKEEEEEQQEDEGEKRWGGGGQCREGGEDLEERGKGREGNEGREGEYDKISFNLLQILTTKDPTLLKNSILVSKMNNKLTQNSNIMNSEIENSEIEERFEKRRKDRMHKSIRNSKLFESEEIYPKNGIRKSREEWNEGVVREKGGGVGEGVGGGGDGERGVGGGERRKGGGGRGGEREEDKLKRKCSREKEIKTMKVKGKDLIKIDKGIKIEEKLQSREGIFKEKRSETPKIRSIFENFKLNSPEFQKTKGVSFFRSEKPNETRLNKNNEMVAQLRSSEVKLEGKKGEG